jgi:hypothetical protein
MKKYTMDEVYNILKEEFPLQQNTIVLFTETVFICNPSPAQIRRGFRKYVDPKKYEGENINTILRDTFTDMMNGAKCPEYQSLKYIIKNYKSKHKR